VLHKILTAYITIVFPRALGPVGFAGGSLVFGGVYPVMIVGMAWRGRDAFALKDRDGMEMNGIGNGMKKPSRALRIHHTLLSTPLGRP